MRTLSLLFFSAATAIAADIFGIIKLDGPPPKRPPLQLTPESRKLYEVMGAMTLTFDSVIEFVAVINNDFFMGLSNEEQQLILDAASVVEEALRDEIYAQESQAVEVLKSRMDVVELTAEERDQWRAATSGVIDRFVREVGPTAEAVVKAGLREENE